MSERTVVVVGSGGREHAIARRLAADPEPCHVVVVPGNDGIARTFECRAPHGDDAGALAETCVAASPDLVVIGPEVPLAAGLADRLAERHVAVFGPGAAAARLESSKWFAKEVMREAGIPTARGECFDAAAPALAAIAASAPPWVLKADGLAAGKGVCVTADRAVAEAFVRDCLAGRSFGDAGRRLLIEEHLAGEELSVMAICDGERAVLLPAARDFKRARDGDTGPNTGGMGAFAPVDLDAAAEADIERRVVCPVLAAMARRGTPFRGALYCGLMWTASGPQVIEFNVRLGDPEAQVILPRVGGSLFDLLGAAGGGTLEGVRAERRPGTTVAVALVDEGYPERLAGTGVLAGTDAVESAAGTWMLYGAVRAGAGGLRIAGGRAAYVCAEAPTREAARQAAYAGIERLGGTGWRFRRDIATMAGARSGR